MRINVYFCKLLILLSFIHNIHIIHYVLTHIREKASWAYYDYDTFYIYHSDFGKKCVYAYFLYFPVCFHEVAKYTTCINAYKCVFLTVNVYLLDLCMLCV